MIRLFPSVTETLVLPTDSAEIANRLRIALENGDLNGNIDGNKFIIAPRRLRPHPFAPTVRGVIEKSSRGCVVFLNYELLRSVRATLWFWFFVVMSGSVGAAYQSGKWWLPALGLALTAVARWIALSNQRLHATAVREALMSNLLGS